MTFSVEVSSTSIHTYLYTLAYFTYYLYLKIISLLMAMHDWAVELGEAWFKACRLIKIHES